VIFGVDESASCLSLGLSRLRSSLRRIGFALASSFPVLVFCRVLVAPVAAEDFSLLSVVVSAVRSGVVSWSSSFPVLEFLVFPRAGATVSRVPPTEALIRSVELLAHRFCLCLKSSLTARLVSGSGTRPDFRAHSIFPKILLFTGKIPFFFANVAGKIPSASD
jgi:hypothetical protein